MNGRFSDERVADWLSSLGSPWLALHHEDPDISSAFTSEITGGSYERVKVVLGQPEGRWVANITSARFSGLPAVRVSWLCGWTAMVNGRLEFAIPMAEPIRFKAGQTHVVNPGDLVLSFD